MQSAYPSRGGGGSLWRFSEVDLRAGELRKRGIKVKGQPFQILRVLLKHPGEVVTRGTAARENLAL